jgi:hypothetical protein
MRRSKSIEDLLKKQFTTWNPINAFVPSDEYNELIRRVYYLVQKQKTIEEIYQFIYNYLHEYMGLSELTLADVKSNIILY